MSIWGKGPISAKKISTVRETMREEEKNTTVDLWGKAPVTRERIESTRKKVTAQPKVSARKQMQEELEQLRKSYTPGGAFGGRTQEDKDTLHRIQYLENQLSRMESDDYYQTALKRLGELDEETIGYLDQLRESSKPKATVEMQGIADNRSWEEIYAEQYQMDERVKKALLDKGYTEEQIAQYVKDRTRQANRENYEAEVAKSRAEADNGVMGAVTASAKSVPQNLTGGLGYLSLAVQRAHNGDEPLDYYTPEMVGQAKAQAARQTVSQKLEENTELSTALTGNVASFLYNTGMSMADSAAVAAMAAVGVPPAIGTTLLGGTAATQATVAAKERGVSDERALLTGLAAGAAEALFEKVSLDKLLSTSPTEGLLRQRVLQGLKNMGIQGTVEGTEEMATSLANAITDALINGGQSEYNQKVQDYMAQGKSAEEADRLATRDFAFSLGADFLGGFISGGAMSVGADTARNSAYKSAYGENAQELTDKALEIDPKNETALYAKKRLEKGKTVSGAVLRSLVSQNQRKIDADNASAAETAEETDEATQDTADVSGGAEAKRTAVSPITHNTEFTEEEARHIVEEGAKEFGNAASSVVNSYMNGQDPQMYMAQARLVFNYGKTMSEEKGIPYALKSPLLKSMDETQIRSLFNAGRMQAKAIPVTAVKGKGEVVLTDGIDYSLLDPVRRKQVTALSSFAKATGYTIELFESKADKDGRYTAELGSFDPATGVIRIDINAGRNKVDDLAHYAMVRVASHEITHSFKKNAPQQYVALRDYVTGILADKGEFDDLVDAKMSDLGLDHETAVDEVVADGCEMMLRDTRFINNLAKENRTLFEKIRDAIRKFVKKIRDAFEGVEIAHEEARLLQDAENLQKLWDEALARSVENVAAAEATMTEGGGEKMLSARDSEYMEAVRNGDMEAAQRMVGEAARAAGYTIEAYHGTNAEFFTFDKGRVGKGQDVYGSGFYFASDRDAAEAYGKRIIPSRIKLENPYRVIVRPTSGGLRDIKLTQKQVYEILKRHPKIRAEDSPLGDFYEEFWEQGAKDWMIRGLARQYTDLQELEGDLFRDYPNELHKAIRDVTGHDGVEVRFQRDETRFSPEDESAFYVAWFDNQMKSAEPVVRDDAGEVIPLSRRFDESQSDIRYSKRDYSYAALTSKPDMTVTAVREETRYDRKTVVENALKSAASVGRRTENGNAVIKVRDIGRDVVVTKRSLVHGLDRRLNVQAPVLENVGSVLQNAIRINELTPRRDDVESTYVLVGAARGTKGMYIASFVVNSITDEVTTVDVLYALNAKKESAALLPKFTDESATPTDSVISVANLLDYVNQYFPDILPEDVLKHYGHHERPAGKLGADALFSFRTGYIPTDRSILAAYVPADSDSDMVKKHIAEYQKNVKELKAMQLKRGLMVHDLEALADNNDPKSKAEKKRLREEIVKTDSLIQGLLDQLSRKERWYGVKEVLQKEKAEIMRKAKAEKNEQLKKYRARRENTESRRKLRERISYRVKTLDKMLRNPTDDKHIPEDLRDLIFAFCEPFTYNPGVFKGKALKRAEVEYYFEGEGKDEAVFDQAKIESLIAKYSALKGKGENNPIAELYDGNIEEMLDLLKTTISGRPLSKLSLGELDLIKSIADHFAFIVKAENEVFLNGRKVKMQTIATKAIEEAKESEKKGSLTIGRDGDAFLKFLTSGNLKPVYLFERTGNQLRDLFNGLLAGQSEYGRRVQKAKAFVEQVKKDTNYSKWSSSEETLKMKNGAGQEIELTVQQAMSLLATYERELRSGKTNHVTMGGFVYENGLTGDVTVKGVKIPLVKRKVEAEAHPMTVEDMDKVRQWLGSIDSGVFDYMERMVEYLSTTMAAYGNETSMQLHGYKKFGEDYYFPIRSSDEYLVKDPGKGGFDENRWKNKGFTKTVDKGANNQFVLIDFDKVWSNHVSQMLMYSTMAVPQESFVRVLNFNTPVDPTGLSNRDSMRSVITQYYGSKVTDYIDTLLRDVNGGVTTDSRENALNRFVSLYKKNAVLGSMSVTVQQISSVARAMAIIDPKYFTKGKPFADFQEALEHSGVAVIKQMGGFDTTTGRGGAEWLMEEVPGGKFRDAKSFSEGVKMFAEKGKALTQFGEKDTGYRDRWLGALPARMDELGFGMIWNAAKNEVSDGGEYEDGTEAFYEAVTKRFEEVIEKTQVYDSVLSRSENMRSKGNLMKAATSFMAEPTVTANMMMDSVWKLRRNKDEDSRKYLGRVIAALLLSVTANNFLKAFATAPRDKDKDQTIVEKWFEDFVGGTVNDLIVTNYIPYLREVTSAVMGYGVEATWFAPAEDLIKATVNWIRDGEFSWGATKDIVNAVSALKGLPTKNLLRIPESIINLFANTASIKEWSWRGMENAALEGILGGLFMPGVDDAIEKAYKADMRGNEAQRKKALEELRQLYEDKAKQYRLEGKEDAAKKAKSSLKSTITSVLKPLYQAAKTQAEKNRIKSLALRVYVGGEQLYNGYDFDRYWGED